MRKRFAHEGAKWEAFRVHADTMAEESIGKSRVLDGIDQISQNDRVARKMETMVPCRASYRIEDSRLIASGARAQQSSRYRSVRASASPPTRGLSSGRDAAAIPSLK
jgi:hypothetical protein